MAWFIGQSLVFILLAFVVGIIAGRLSMHPSKKVEPVAVIDEELERIEGVGPAMANALRAAGIRTFEQLADSGEDTKRDAIRAAGLSFAPSLATWSRQARLLADGDEAAFEELTRRLIAGRDTTPPAATPRGAATQPGSGAVAGSASAVGAHPASKPRPRPRPRPADQPPAPEKPHPADQPPATEKPHPADQPPATEKPHPADDGPTQAGTKTAGEETGAKAGTR